MTAIFLKSVKIALKDAKVTKSKNMLKGVTNMTSKWNQKLQNFFQHASRSLVCIRLFVVAFQSEEEVL